VKNAIALAVASAIILHFVSSDYFWEVKGKVAIAF
jgi:hypothetical protein